MKVWITKYALAKGIIERDIGNSAKTDRQLVFQNDNGYYESYLKPDWHTDSDEAFARAEQMRVKKIAALKKQIAKLEAMKF